MNNWRERIAACALGVFISGCGSKDAATGSPAEFSSRGLVEELRIGPETADLSSSGYLLVAPNGDILITQGPENAIRVFGHDGSTSSIGRTGGGPGEFQRLTRAGWIGDSLWVLDPGLRRISYFDAGYRFLGSVKDPGTGVDPDPSHRVSLFVQAVLPDGALRALASPYPNTPPPDWLSDLGPDTSAYVRLSVSGAHLGRLAVKPPDPCYVNWSLGGGGSAGHVLPFCGRPISTDWDGTGNLGSIVVHEADTDSASYRLTVIDHLGDTTLTRSFPFTPIRVSQFKLDSAAAVQAERDAAGNPAVISSRPPLTPGTTLPPIRAIVLGQDGTVWLEEEEELVTHQWLLLNAQGDPIGRVTLPENARLRVAERGMIWATTTDENDLVGIVRYRVTDEQAAP